MDVKIKKLNPEAIIPTRGTKEAAGMDLCTVEEAMIAPHETKLLHIGIAMAIPEGYFGAVYPRSGLSTKEGLRLANCVGVIDSDYRGEIMVPVHNDNEFFKKVEKGQKIAQMIIQAYPYVDLVECDDLGETERGSNGFGSTGKYESK